MTDLAGDRYDTMAAELLNAQDIRPATGLAPWQMANLQQALATALREAERHPPVHGGAGC